MSTGLERIGEGKEGEGEGEREGGEGDWGGETGGGRRYEGRRGVRAVSELLTADLPSHSQEFANPSKLDPSSPFRLDVASTSPFGGGGEEASRKVPLPVPFRRACPAREADLEAALAYSLQTDKLLRCGADGAGTDEPKGRRGRARGGQVGAGNSDGNR